MKCDKTTIRLSNDQRKALDKIAFDMTPVISKRVYRWQVLQALVARHTKIMPTDGVSLQLVEALDGVMYPENRPTLVHM